jgi:hypothetical protein
MSAHVITRPQPVTRPSPSPSSRSFWRLASGVWRLAAGCWPLACSGLGRRPRRQRLYYCVAGTRYWVLGTCPTRTCLPSLHQCSHDLRTDGPNSLSPPQGRRGSLGNALRPPVSFSPSLANQRSLSPMRSSGLAVNGRLAHPHVISSLAIDYVVE